MYIPAKIADPKNHLIEIGTGYFVEMSTEKAVDYFRRKQAFLKKQVSFCWMDLEFKNYLLLTIHFCTFRL